MEHPLLATRGTTISVQTLIRVYINLLVTMTLSFHALDIMVFFFFTPPRQEKKRFLVTP